MSTVKITNKYWSNMHIQIRIGNQSIPENNALMYDGPLPNGQPVSFNFPVFLFYRRDANPDFPNGNFSAWTQCFTDQTIDNP